MPERNERGMSLIEVLVSLAVLITVVLGLYTLLDRGNKRLEVVLPEGMLELGSGSGRESGGRKRAKQPDQPKRR